MQIINTAYLSCAIKINDEGYASAQGSGSHWQLITNISQSDSAVNKEDGVPSVYLLCSLHAEVGDDIKLFLAKLYSRVSETVRVYQLSV